MMVKVVDIKETMNSDQTGKFPYLSSKGMWYMMVAYHSNTNYIFVETKKLEQGPNDFDLWKDIQTNERDKNINCIFTISDSDFN